MKEFTDKIITVPVLSACILFIWGVHVSWPGTRAFHKVGTTIYWPMIEIVDAELFWGILFLVISFGCIVLIYKANSHLASLILSISFILISCLFFIGDLTNRAWAVYGVIGLFNFVYWESHIVTKKSNVNFTGTSKNRTS